MQTNATILERLQRMYRLGYFRGNTVEIQGANFLVTDEEIIPNTSNHYYQDAEIEWYMIGTRKVQTLFDIYGQEVKIWKNIADENGEVNSNYGWCIFSEERGYQFDKACEALSNPLSRQAVMYYTHPHMHDIAGKDHTCTYAVQYFINYENDTFGRGYVDAHVYMRSNDAVFGFNNDYAWQRHVLRMVCNKIDALEGDIFWNVGSLHVYERHYHRLEGTQLELDV